MDKWEPLIERMIRESMDRGEFDDLPGAGQPIDLTENPFEAPELRSVHRLLRNAGFAPAWIEERKDIDSSFKQAHTILRRARELKEFRECVDELNQRIRVYNLKAPATAFHRNIIDADQALKDLEG